MRPRHEAPLADDHPDKVKDEPGVRKSSRPPKSSYQQRLDHERNQREQVDLTSQWSKEKNLLTGQVIHEFSFFRNLGCTAVIALTKLYT